jgi:hypothetical protein
MKTTSLALACLALMTCAASGFAADAKKPDAGAPQLPPGWTAEEMERCIQAGTPGEGQARLARDVGTWVGKSSVWMAPGMDPIKSEVVAEYAPVMEGRYVRCEMSGNCPVMGPFQGIAILGFDNVSKKFVSSMIDNHSTGIMQGEGDLAKDGKTINWTYVANCPREQKPVTLRQVETAVSPTAKTLEMFATDPKSGDEFKMMQIEFTKK